MNIKHFLLELGHFYFGYILQYAVNEVFLVILKAYELVVTMTVKFPFRSTKKREFEYDELKVFPFQINTTKISEIKKIIYYSNSQTVPDSLFALQNTNNLAVYNKISKSESTDVIKNLRPFVRNTLGDMRKRVNLHHKIQTLFTVFSHAPRKKVKFHYQVNTSIMILGSEFKLFKINSLKEKNKVHWNFCNIGWLIPKNIREVMFVKFFLPKLNKSVTRLGLSIVKTILENHNATAVFESETELTILTLKFNTILTNGKN
jgi:hypothetical protein